MAMEDRIERLLRASERHLVQCELVLKESGEAGLTRASKETRRDYFVHYRKVEAVLDALQHLQPSLEVKTAMTALHQRWHSLPEISLLTHCHELDQQEVVSALQEEPSLTPQGAEPSLPPGVQTAEEEGHQDAASASAIALVSRWSDEKAAGGAKTWPDEADKAGDTPDKAVEEPFKTVVETRKTKSKWYTNRDELFALADDVDDERATSKSGDGAQMAENILQHHRENQEILSKDLLNMSRSLRANAAALSTTLEKDKSILEQADVRLAANLTRTKKEGGRLDQYVAKNGSTTGLMLLSLAVAISGWLIAFVVIRLT